MLWFQFNVEFQDSRSTATEVISLNSDNAARSHAAKLAKKFDCPVDLARAAFDGSIDKRTWNDRYMTTAMPSDVHAKGVRFERLAD